MTNNAPSWLLVSSWARGAFPAHSNTQDSSPPRRSSWNHLSKAEGSGWEALYPGEMQSLFHRCAAQPGNVAVLAWHRNHALAFSFSVHRAHKTYQHGTQLSSVAELLFQGHSLSASGQRKQKQHSGHSFSSVFRRHFSNLQAFDINRSLLHQFCLPPAQVFTT